MGKQRVHIWVSGSVQGVFFRYSARLRAEELDLTGYVRNLYDGRVEIVAEGEKDKLISLVSWAHRGPTGARVREVNVEWEKPTDSYSSFAITY